MAQRKNKPELKIVVSNTPEALAVEAVPEQVEMPFAIVNGEPLTQMPKDLYIPPQAMEVFLEAFEGPLDLLLYLIRRQNLNILDIPLAEITRQYMKYIEVMTELQLELAGEYMVMAATLAEIKSRMLLPRPKMDAEGQEDDPRAELVRRLQEYERFKRAAEDIDALPRLERDVWMTSADLKDRKVVKLLPTITLQEMLIAFKDVVVRSEMFAHHHIQRERLSVRARMSEVLTTLEHSSFIEFVRLFRVEEGRMGVTVTFMAILELVREGLVEIVQAEPFAPIHVRAAGASRKLHVVASNEALAAPDALVAASAIVVGEAVVSDAPGVGVLPSHDPYKMEGFTELVLDPDFVDDSEEDLEAGPLEGVDDVVGFALATDAGATAVDLTDAQAADFGLAAIEPISGLAEGVEVATTEPTVVQAEDAIVAAEPLPTAESVATAIDSIMAGEPAPAVSLASPDAGAAVAVAEDAVAADSALPGGPPRNIEPPAALVHIGAVVESAPIDHEIGVAGWEPGAGNGVAVASSELPNQVAVVAEPLPTAETVAVAVESILAGAPVPVVESPAEPEVAREIVESEPVIGHIDVPTESVHSLPEVPIEFSVAGTQGDTVLEPAGTLEPSDVPTSAATECDVIAEPPTPVPPTEEGVVTVDPAVFDPPIASDESEPPSGAPPDEPPQVDVEYAGPDDPIASGEQPPPDDDVSLIGETPVAGEVSLVGDDSVSGGPTVEVEEFAFDELPALDETPRVDEQPAVDAQPVVKNIAGTDEPPSPGEESDD